MTTNDDTDDRDPALLAIDLKLGTRTRIETDEHVDRLDHLRVTPTGVAIGLLKTEAE